MSSVSIRVHSYHKKTQACWKQKRTGSVALQCTTENVRPSIFNATIIEVGMALLQEIEAGIVSPPHCRMAPLLMHNEVRK